jgi:hypothetical protein
LVKRISCRVISSAAFSKPCIGAASVKQPREEQYEICDTVATVNPRTIIKPVKNRDMPGISLLNVEFPTGRILDIFA